MWERKNEAQLERLLDKAMSFPFPNFKLPFTITAKQPSIPTIRYGCKHHMPVHIILLEEENTQDNCQSPTGR